LNLTKLLIIKFIIITKIYRFVQRLYEY
jgi:hypothetical protein